MLSGFQRRSLAGLLIAGTMLGATAASAAPITLGSRPVAAVTPIEQVRVVCDQYRRCWNTRSNNGAAVGAAIGLGILGAAGAAAAASQYAAPPPAYYPAPGYYAPAPAYCTAYDAYGRPVTVQC